MSMGTERHPPRVTADSSPGEVAVAKGPPGHAKAGSDSVEAKRGYQQGTVDLPGATITRANDYTPDVMKEMEWAMADADGETDVEKELVKTWTHHADEGIINRGSVVTTMAPEHKHAVSPMIGQEAVVTRYAKGEVGPPRRSPTTWARSRSREDGCWPSRS